MLVRDGRACQHVRTDTQTPCLQLATHVDHIVPAFEGGSDDVSNLRALCEYHHRRKTAREANRARSAVPRRTLHRPRRMNPYL
ncbi:hypothetical protein GCM10020229_45830 [Kitasatospora albolonga]|uniref:HNH endonuclease n=1 Tax=Kitasatospora albolonga TaxID=68173 RepID=UPI0031E5A674